MLNNTALSKLKVASGSDGTDMSSYDNEEVDAEARTAEVAGDYTVAEKLSFKEIALEGSVRSVLFNQLYGKQMDTVAQT